MRLQVLSNNRLSLVEGGQTTSILGGRMSLRISPTELRPEVMFTPDCKLPSSFLIWDEVTSDRDNALRYRSWQPLRTDTSIVIHEGDSRHEVRIVVEPDEPADAQQFEKEGNRDALAFKGITGDVLAEMRQAAAEKRAEADRLDKLAEDAFQVADAARADAEAQIAASFKASMDTVQTHLDKAVEFDALAASMFDTFSRYGGK